MYGYGSGMSWWMGVGMVLITALVIAGIAFAAILVARQLKPSVRPGGDDARTSLAARFARDEIDDKEFSRRADLLTRL